MRMQSRNVHLIKKRKKKPQTFAFIHSIPFFFFPFDSLSYLPQITSSLFLIYSLGNQSLLRCMYIQYSNCIFTQSSQQQSQITEYSTRLHAPWAVRRLVQKFSYSNSSVNLLVPFWPSIQPHFSIFVTFILLFFFLLFFSFLLQLFVSHETLACENFGTFRSFFEKKKNFFLRGGKRDFDLFQ